MSEKILGYWHMTKVRAQKARRNGSPKRGNSRISKSNGMSDTRTGIVVCNSFIREQMPNARFVPAIRAATGNPGPAFQVSLRYWQASEPARLVPYLRCNGLVSWVGYEGCF